MFLDSYIFELKKVGKYVVKVLQDELAENPRTFMDHSDHMICFHKRYKIGDKHTETKESLNTIIKRKDVVFLPVYLYDHSGLTISTSPFCSHWDSGQIGFIYMTKEDIFEVYGKKKILTGKLKEKALEYMNASIEEYDQYLTGTVYGYIVENENGEQVESCWGFYGESKDCLQEGIKVAESLIRYDLKRHINKVKQYIINKVPLEKRMIRSC